MARIGKIVDFNGSKETISWSFTSNTQMHIYGEQADLTILKAYANSKGLDFTIGGDAPAEAVPDVETPPTQAELDARDFLKTAFGEMKTEEINRLMTIWQTKYDAINTSGIAFADVPKGDFKWLR
jgi:hypothetical protein